VKIGRERDNLIREKILLQVTIIGFSLNEVFIVNVRGFGRVYSYIIIASKVFN
jgi:hypothetical protein